MLLAFSHSLSWGCLQTLCGLYLARRRNTTPVLNHVFRETFFFSFHSFPCGFSSLVKSSSQFSPPFPNRLIYQHANTNKNTRFGSGFCKPSRADCTTQDSPFRLAGLADLALWRSVTDHERSGWAFKVLFKIQSTQGLWQSHTFRMRQSSKHEECKIY